MSHGPADERWTQWWRWTVIVLSTLILCSCRAPAARQGATACDAPAPCASPPPIAPVMAPPLPCMPPPLPIPYNVCATACAHDELVCDGGDRNLGVLVSPSWQVFGLDTQDTVAHFDTLDGRTLVEPSNCVCIYAPRFGAVRSITRLVSDEQIDTPNGMTLPIAAARQDDLKIAATNLQRYQPHGEVGRRMPEGFTRPENPVPISNVLIPVGVQDNLLPYANLDIIRRGIFDDAEKARLAQAVAAAIEWTADQAVQVVIEGQPGVPLTGDQRAQVVFTVEDKRHCPKLRVIKVASTQTARSGDIVDFTIRFDNIGDQPLGNIVLIDNLTPRLEYIDGSAQASVKAAFSTTVNPSQSLVLRWEIADAIERGDGGIVRFRCRVR
jgi:uncharacterized repeat protein (TIGR01451 family)